MQLGNELLKDLRCVSLAMLATVVSLHAAYAQVSPAGDVTAKSFLELEKYEQALKERERLLLEGVPEKSKEPSDIAPQHYDHRNSKAAFEDNKTQEQDGATAARQLSDRAVIVDRANDSEPSSLIRNELDARLQAADKRIGDLLKELDAARRRLVIAETEVERLSSIIEGRSGRSVGAASPENRSQASAAQIQKPLVPEMPIATVTVNKANLRTGPGLDNSPLMTVSRGTRLAIETRQGDWYRVITPTGARAWVSGDVIAFGAKDQWAPSQTVRVGGYDLQAEEAAFALISKGIE